MSKRLAIFDNGPLSESTCFVDPEKLICALQPEDVPRAFSELEAASLSGKWLAGYASYELGYVFEPKLLEIIPKNRTMPLLCFGVFDAPSSVPVDESNDISDLATPQPHWDEAQYLSAFNTVRKYLAAGDIYQVNLTFPLSARYGGHLFSLYKKLREKQAVPHGAYIDFGGPVILTRSPELFFSVNENREIVVQPMKGTARRGETCIEDKAQIEWLRNSTKNRAENTMIVDLMRNDLNRIAEVGSVTVTDFCTIETYRTVHQMTSRIAGQLQPQISLHEIFRALFPCGSITGAPKIRAMEIIRSLEHEPREVYCGSIGWISPSGEMKFNVAIRSLICAKNQLARLNVGSGVIYDSTAAEEYAECLIKAKFAEI